MVRKDEFLYPRTQYHGQVTPEYLIFNANLQEFAQRIGFISNLQTNGKLSPEESYQQIKKLWDQLDGISKQLNITRNLSHLSHECED